MFPSHKFILFALVVFLLLLFTSYHSHQFETFISEHIIYSNVQPIPLETYSPSSLQPSTTTPNNLFETIDQQQCSCPNCGCNGQNTCPKGLPANSFVVLSAMEDCAATNQVPAIGLVNIESTSASNQFIFGIVDEDNKNKAMNNQQFDASVYKSNRSPQTCVSDSSPPFRYPAKVPGKVYLIGKSTNLVMDTNVRFNIQMSCAIPPYNRISMVAKPNELSRIYVGKRMTWSFSFINQYSNVDTWQKGTLKTSDNAYTPVTDGSSSLLYTPTSEGSFSLSLSYTPSSSIYGDAFNFNTQQIQVYKIAAGGSIEVPAKVSKREFIVKYNIKDSDGTVTPQIDKSSLSFKSEPSVDLFCINPTSDTGSGSVTCSATKTGTSVITLLYEGKTVATSLSFAVVENDSNNDDGKYWINYQTAIIAMLVLAVIVIGIVVIAGTAGIFVYCRKRRNAQRVKLSEEDQVEDLGA